MPTRWGNLGTEAKALFLHGGFLKWYPTTMGFPTKHDHFGVYEHRFLFSHKLSVYLGLMASMKNMKMFFCGSLFLYLYLILYTLHLLDTCYSTLIHMSAGGM